MKAKHPIFLKSVSALVIGIFLGVTVYLRAGKSRTEFQRVSGIVSSVSNSSSDFPNKDSVKFRYLQMDQYPKTFELFIGKDAGDFKPQFEKIDQLQAGDSISVFFDENSNTINDPVNRLAYFIDRGQEVIFIKGGSEKYLAYFIIGFSVACIAGLIILKKKGTIT